MENPDSLVFLQLKLLLLEIEKELRRDFFVLLTIKSSLHEKYPDTMKYHRDGIGYIYQKDPSGNHIEILDQSS